MEPRANLHVAVNVVTWNSEEYLADFLDSLKNQTFKDFSVIIVDNGSRDKTLGIAQAYPEATIIKNSANLGFGRAHNKGIEMAMKFWEGGSLADKFIFICNPDVILAPDCLEKILLAICRENDVGVAGPKLLRLESKVSDNIYEKEKTNIIDSLGLSLYKSRRVADSLSGAKNEDALEAQEVFGVSGALMCFRAEALKSVLWNKEYFDEDFFAYKEDIDICWRLRNLDWRIIVAPSAVAYHHRSMRGNEKLSIFGRILNQKRKPDIIKFWSVRNHLWTIFKNDFYVNWFLDLPFIFASELMKFVYYLVLDTKSVRAYFSALIGLRKMVAKRRYLKMAKIRPKEFREWIE